MEPVIKKSKMGNNGKFKQHKKKYFLQGKRQVLQAGHRGFLVTCNMNEKACVRECYNLLNHYADKLYGSQLEESLTKENVETDVKKDCDDSDSDDLEAAAAKSRASHTMQRARFQNVETGTANCLFIRTQLDDPVSLGKHIVEDITLTGKAMSRFVLRLVPIEVVCRANMPDIIDAAGALFDKHFLTEPTSYGIIFNHRYNQQIKRDHIIKELADLVTSKNIGNKVDLQHAKKSIIVEVLRGWCLLSVIDNYLESKRYNLSEIANPGGQKLNEEEKAADKKSDASVEPAEKAMTTTTTAVPHT